MTRRLLWLCCFTTSLCAYAVDMGNTNWVIGEDQCSVDGSFSYSWDTITIPPNNIPYYIITREEFGIGEVNCPATAKQDAENVIQKQFRPQASTTIKSTFNRKTIAPDALCNNKAENHTMAICLYVDNGGSYTLAAGATYNINTKSLEAPILADLRVDDEKLTLYIKDPGSNSYNVCYAPNDIDISDDACVGKIVEKKASPIEIGDLENGVTYNVKAQQVEGDKKGPWSTQLSAIPVEGISPFDHYDGPANPLAFNCNTAFKSPFALALIGLLLASLFYLRRGHRS